MNENDLKRYKKIQIYGFIFVSLFILIICFVIGYLLNRNYTLERKYNDLNDKVNSNLSEISNFDYEKDEAEFIDLEEVAFKRELKALPDGEEYPDKQRIYLTFDDGPGKYTNELLDILEEYGVKATFFVIYQPNHEEEYRRIVDNGHTLAIHSYDHSYKKIYKSVDGFKEDIDKTYDFLLETTGQEPLFYRFPGGSSNTIFKGNKNDLIDVLNDKNLVYYDWNCDSNDASKKALSSNQIANNVIKGIGNKKEAIVLMHDTNAKLTSIEAVPLILDYYMEDDNVIFLPITETTEPIQHVKKK